MVYATPYLYFRHEWLQRNLPATFWRVLYWPLTDSVKTAMPLLSEVQRYMRQDEARPLVWVGAFFSLLQCFDNFKTAKITFDTLHSSPPAYLHSALHAHHSTWSLRLSNDNLLSIPFVHTSFGARNFGTAAPTIWNYLPPAIRMCTSPDTLRSTISSRPCNPLSSFLMHLKFGFGWPLCAFTNHIYLLPYLHHWYDDRNNIQNLYQLCLNITFRTCEENQGRTR